ncbi:MAG TPA: rRNA maturation RNase YbeY [bacterium]|nr:rRNA maturation RNase YbeY [bacterium]
MKISVTATSTAKPALGRSAVLRVVKATLAAEGLRSADPWEVAIRFTAAADIRAVNREWRGIDRATDVISFPAAEGQGGEYAGFLLGDLLIAPEVVAAHARQYRTTVERETAFVIVHGLLHLLGYDHATVSERRLMRERQNAIMERIGHGAA